MLGSVLLLAAGCSAREGSDAATASACSTAVGYRAQQIGGRTVALWYPTSVAPTPFAYGPQFSSVLAHDAPPTRACGAAVPLVVFSHGDLGCGLQSVTFTEELARHGYVVAAPDHADAALCHTPMSGSSLPSAPPAQPPILRPQAWSEESRQDRRQDVESVIDELLADREFASVIDAQRIGLAGHSLGGYTVVGIAGGWPSWKDARVRAVLALSPYVMPFQVQKTLSDVHIPIMYQGGTLDVGITPFLRGPQGAFAAAQAPAYLLVLRAAGHFAWVNCGHEHTTQACLEHVADARLAAQYGIAFFDRHLKGLPAPQLDRADARLALYEHK
ncbi:MAG TPA: hypothetical protein VME21_02010 [Steroidobacteraceae bacterium]|nr:hypothetical protein [Steroidobacteraceae bacterium]